MYFGRQTNVPTVTSKGSSFLCMHGGHNHHHHEHALPTTTDPTTVARKRLRLAASFVFSAFATLGARLVLRKSLRTLDYVAFAAVVSVLCSADTVRRKILGVTNKVKLLRQTMQKHSTPGFNMEYMMQTNNSADRVTVLGVVVNLILSVGKFAIGTTCHSSALIADAGHSLSDLFSDFVTLYSVQIARIPPDDDHPYGHGKFEAIGSLFLALTLLATGVSVGAMANRQLMIHWANGGASMTVAPTMPAFVMAGISILSKEWLYRVTKQVGDALNSQVVIANAWHHRSDAYSSVLALISIGLAMTGFIAADSAAGLLVAGMICMTGADILGESIKQLTDTSNNDLAERVREIVQGYDDVSKIGRIRARQVGSKALVDVKIETRSSLSTSAARTVEERIRNKILQTQGVLDAEVHAEPPAIVCPLLLNQEKEKPSALSIESLVRQQALLHPNVTSIVGVTVHFTNTTSITVDVNIRVEPGTTLLMTRQLASEYRAKLEDSSSMIDRANIFLDLNDEMSLGNEQMLTNLSGSISS
jgi:cation diffusion facilitator family transporter